MPSVPSDSVRAYRTVGLFIVAALITFVVLFRLGATDSMDVLVGLCMVGAGAAALVTATFVGPAAHRHLRTGTYLLFLLTIGVVSWLAYRNAFDIPYAVGLVFMVSALGLGGGVSSTTVRWIGTCIGLAVALPLLGLALTAEPLVDPWAYGAILLANGAAVFLIVRNRIQVRARLETERQQYQSVFDRAAEGIYLADVETLRVLDANPAYLALTGRTLDDIRTLRVPDFVVLDPAGPSVEEVARSVAQPGSTFAGSHLHRTADGRLIDVDVSVSSLMHSGRPTFSVIVRDATARRETERRQEEARERAEQVLHFKSALLSNISHEVRTPLTGILGYAELLRHELEGEPLSYTEAIMESAQRLHETLESLLSLAEAESGITVELTPVELASTLSPLVDTFTRKAAAKGLELTMTTPDAPIRVLADRRALPHAVRHLLGNAIKFTESGSVQIELEADDSHARVRVRDTGVGISEAFRPHLFEAFQQASVGLKRTHQGAGLGLTLAKRLVDSMQGTIEVESDEGVGSTFTIRLPLALPEGSGIGHHQRDLPWPDSSPRTPTDVSKPSSHTS
ncbi:MAG: PAS domain-containing sensor histidine kinase [Bacteroidota bacterium]